MRIFIRASGAIFAALQAVDMTAPETFTAASKRPLTTRRRPDMTAISAKRKFMRRSIDIGSGTNARGPK